jgi:guanosine-3',5'-bis(diphosphate) 3'-pyrophosphohydrolase
MSDAPALALILRATAFAAAKHRNQRRKDAEASPYINHPIALADTLVNEGGVDDPAILAAAILHDTIEDTDTTAQELRDIFGAVIAEVVLEVTDDKSLDRDRRKQAQLDHARHLSPRAAQVKIADKISNLRDILATPPADWSAARKREYFEWAKAIVDAVRGANAKLEAVFDAVYARGGAFVD